MHLTVSVIVALHNFSAVLGDRDEASASCRDEAEKFQRLFRMGTKLMPFVGSNKNDRTRFDGVFAAFTFDRPFPIQHKNLVLPRVLMPRR